MRYPRENFVSSLLRALTTGGTSFLQARQQRDALAYQREQARLDREARNDAVAQGKRNVMAGVLSNLGREYPQAQPQLAQRALTLYGGKDLTGDAPQQSPANAFSQAIQQQAPAGMLEPGAASTPFAGQNAEGGRYALEHVLGNLGPSRLDLQQRFAERQAQARAEEAAKLEKGRNDRAAGVQEGLLQRALLNIAARDRSTGIRSDLSSQVAEARHVVNLMNTSDMPYEQALAEAAKLFRRAPTMRPPAGPPQLAPAPDAEAPPHLLPNGTPGAMRPPVDISQLPPLPPNVTPEHEPFRDGAGRMGSREMAMTPLRLPLGLPGATSAQPQGLTPVGPNAAPPPLMPPPGAAPPLPAPQVTIRPSPVTAGQIRAQRAQNDPLRLGISAQNANTASAREARMGRQGDRRLDISAATLRANEARVRIQALIEGRKMDVAQGIAEMRREDGKLTRLFQQQLAEIRNAGRMTPGQTKQAEAMLEAYKNTSKAMWEYQNHALTLKPGPERDQFMGYAQQMAAKMDEQEQFFVKLGQSQPRTPDGRFTTPGGAGRTPIGNDNFTGVQRLLDDVFGAEGDTAGAPGPTWTPPPPRATGTRTGARRGGPNAARGDGWPGPGLPPASAAGMDRLYLPATQAQQRGQLYGPPQPKSSPRETYIRTRMGAGESRAKAEKAAKAAGY